MSRSHSFFKNGSMSLGAQTGTEDFSSDEEDGIEVSATFSKRDYSLDVKVQDDQVALLTAQSAWEGEKISRRKLIAKHPNGLYVLVSPIKPKKIEAEKNLETKAWKSGCACAIL